MRTRIKICGVTNLADAQTAAEAGVDAIGMILGYPKSSRCISVERAAEIAAALPPFVTPVALFVDAQPPDVERALREARVQMMQFHGSDEIETPEYCRQFGRPYMKAIRMAPEVDLVQYALRYRDARALLLDAHVAGIVGGTGQSFDWQRVPSGLSLPIVLSGGLHPGNVALAIRQVRPAAVDVSSGVERDDAKGCKDHAKIRAFVRAVRDIDAEQSDS